MNLPKIIEQSVPSEISIREQEDSEEDINRLLQNLQGEKAKSTQKTYQYALIDFAKFFATENKLSFDGNNLSQIMPIFLALSKIKGLTIVSNYMSYLRGEYFHQDQGIDSRIKPQSTSTIYTKLTVLKTYVRQARAINQLLPGNKQEWNLDDLKARKVEHKKVHGPSKNQFSILLEYFLNLESETKDHTPSYIDLRNSLLFFVLSFTGLRISGALSIDIEDIDVENSVVRVLLKGKGPSKSDLSIADLLRERILKFLKMDGRTSGPLFINKDQIKESTSGHRLRRESAYRIIKSLCEKAGVKDIHPHKFRHFAATEGLDAAGDNILKAMKFTTHSSQKVFMDYLDNRKNDQKTIADKVAETWLNPNSTTKL